MKTAEISVREQILETASRLFFTQGYNLTGINQIIEEAGVAKASLYYHFPSKEDLCVAYLQYRHGFFWGGKLPRYLEGVTDPRERILKMFDCRAAYFLETNYGGCAYNRIISELPQRSEKIDRQVRLQKERQRGVILEEVRKLEGVDPSYVQDLAYTVFLLFDGATVQCQLFQDLQPLEYAKKAVERLLPQP